MQTFIRTLTVAVAMFMVLIVGCSGARPKKELPPTGKVKAVVEREVEKKGAISLEVKQIEELAERSTADKGAEALLTPQRVATIGDFFEHYDVGPDNAIVASVYNKDGKSGSDIWIFKTGKTRLTKTNYFHYTPSFSSDGNAVYFVSDRGKKPTSEYDQTSYVWRIPSNGAGGITRIGTPCFRYDAPVESPSGRYILVSAKEFYQTDFFVWYMERNGALPTQLKQGFGARWLGDRKIIFQSRDENTGRLSIWTCNLDGSNLTQIISDPEMDCLMPAPSPNGELVAYVKQKHLSKKDVGDLDKLSEVLNSRDIYIYKYKDGLSQQITTNISRDDIPRWSPDGKFLYFRSSRGLSWNIWRLSTDFLQH